MSRIKVEEADSKDLTVEQKDLAQRLSLLGERELQAYKYSIKNKQPELSPALSDELYELFLQGRTCEEIRKTKPALAFGAIVRARIDQLWDKRAADHQRELLQRVPVVVQQTQLESAEFISKLLMASHKMLEGQINDFLATGDKKHLSGTFLENITVKQYRDLLSTLVEATGQNQKKTVVHTGGITVTPQRAPSAAEAHSILDAVEIVRK